MNLSKDLLKSDALEMLKGLVRIPSVSCEEQKVSDYIFSRFSGWGITAERAGCNIICRSREFDEARHTLMLCAHIDTVAPCKDYDSDPFCPDQSSFPEAVYGLGSNDDGGSVAAMTAAFRWFEDKTLPFNLLLVLTAEEEKSGKGGMQSLWPEKLAGLVGSAIIGEPTGMDAAIAERGLIVVDGTACGISGHAARDEGENALYKAVEDIQKLRSHVFGKISPTMGEVHLAVTQISGGTVHNVVPDRCTFIVDIRPTDAYDNAELVDELRKECSSRLVARNLSHKSSSSREGSPLVRCAGDLGLRKFVSPTTSDWMLVDCDAIKMGPGDSARSHKKNEYLLYSELYEAIDIYINFIEHYADTLE